MDSAYSLEEKDSLIIGVDFGTTYSGVAYAFSNKPDKVYAITEWPGAEGRIVPKTPTVMRYGTGGKIQWGYELDRTTDNKIVGIKLLLDPNQERPLFDTEGVAATQAKLEKLEKDPVEIVSDYLTAIYEHAMKVIRGKVPRGYLSELEIVFILSVPAVWSDKAKDATLRAAHGAGLTPIVLIKEPEAAALFTLNQLKEQGLEVGDAITICDAGGGTVDLVSYEIVELNPLELKELVPSTGGIAGSMILNDRFETFIRRKVGDRCFLDLKETSGWRIAMKTFDENIKPRFQGPDDDDQYLNFPMANIPDDRERGIQANTVTITGSGLHAIFEPVSREIDRLLGDQINKVRIKRLQEQHPKGADVKAIFLVGGFGSSLSLRDSIRKAHPDIQVIQPHDAWSAIVQGAVLSRLPQEATVVSSVAERHYGVTGGEIFDPIRDSNHSSHKYWDTWEERYRITRMSWYIKKNDDLKRDRSILFRFTSDMAMNTSPKDMKRTFSLRSCESDVAPWYPDHTVQYNCSLTVDLSKVPRELWSTRTRASNRTQYRSLSYELVVKLEGARMVFSFKCGGKEYGAVEAKY